MRPTALRLIPSLPRAELLALLALAAPAGAQTPPTGWRWIADVPARPVPGEEVSDSTFRFVTMPPGWHVTTGPAVVLLPTGREVSGRFRLESEIFLFPSGAAAAYGLIVGGHDMAGPGRGYLAFLLRADGYAAALRRSGEKVDAVAEWRQHAAVRPTVESGTVRNVLAVEVGAAEAVLHVNGEPVLSVPRDAAEVEGAIGFHLGADVNVHIATLDVTERLAPPRR